MLELLQSEHFQKAVALTPVMVRTPVCLRAARCCACCSAVCDRSATASLLCSSCTPSCAPSYTSLPLGCSQWSRARAPSPPLPPAQEDIHGQQFYHWQHYRTNRVRDGTAAVEGPAAAAVAVGGGQQPAAAAAGGGG